MRVLIADDEALTRMGLQTMLRDMGHTIAGAAADGTVALRLAGEARPDLAILDIKMPGMNGIEAMQKIVGKKNNIPINHIEIIQESPMASGPKT